MGRCGKDLAKAFQGDFGVGRALERSRCLEAVEVKGAGVETDVESEIFETCEGAFSVPTFFFVELETQDRPVHGKREVGVACGREPASVARRLEGVKVEGAVGDTRLEVERFEAG